MTPVLLTLALHYEHDIVLTRRRARQIADLLGFDPQDQTRIATAVSEIARNAFRYAGGGLVEFLVEGRTAPQVLTIRVTDGGTGIADLDEVLDGRYTSPTGLGMGIRGARRLVDVFDIRSGPDGTVVTLKKLLPSRCGLVGDPQLRQIADALAARGPDGTFEEVQQQNQELLRTLTELGRRQEELLRLNRELEDTNRGVVALYAELDEKADHLRRADELKSRFLSNMTHEFRTPVNSIQALARLLLERADGDLTIEQERQVGFIARAAEALSELVNDLLDLAKVEAGKTEVRPTHFDVGNLFGALRGMLRPLLANDRVSLVFEVADGLPPVFGDEPKLSQILRNLVSNALKFTESGEVRVSARVTEDRQNLEFLVSDTGIGIAAEDHERIFQEFAQVDHPMQRGVRGTGLGLPLCRRLAQLLHGRLWLRSAPGAGSTFGLVIPILYENPREDPGWVIDRGSIPVLVVEDSAETVMLYEKFIAGHGFQLLPASSVRAAREALATLRPRAIILDILLRGEETWELLVELKRDAKTRGIPVLAITSVEDHAKCVALGVDTYRQKPIDRHDLLQSLTRLVAPESMRRVLVVDDEEILRYIVRQNLSAPHVEIIEAATGTDALRLANESRPDAICLDLTLPDLPGEEVLRRLRLDPVTRHIPVIVVTSRVLTDAARGELLREAAAVVSKDSISRLQSVLEGVMGANQGAS